MSVEEILFRIEALEAEIKFAESQLLPHDTGHIYTAINWMYERIVQLENDIRSKEFTLRSSAG